MKRELFKLYHKATHIENIDHDTFRDIVNRVNKDVSIALSGSGFFRLTNGTTIKCICHYYYKTEIAPTARVQPVISPNTCTEIRNSFDFNHNLFNCTECHKKCISLLEEKKMKKKLL